MWSPKKRLDSTFFLGFFMLRKWSSHSSLGKDTQRPKQMWNYTGPYACSVWTVSGLQALSGFPRTNNKWPCGFGDSHDLRFWWRGARPAMSLMVLILFQNVIIFFFSVNLTLTEFKRTILNQGSWNKEHIYGKM